MYIRKEIRTIIMFACHENVSAAVAEKPFYTAHGGVRMQAAALMRPIHQEIVHELLHEF